MTDRETSVRGWTALLKGYFTTTILPRLWGPMGFRRASNEQTTLAEVRTELGAMLRADYGDQADRPNAREALASYIPSWTWSADVEAGAAPGGGTWSWDPTTGLLVHEYDPEAGL